MNATESAYKEFVRDAQASAIVCVDNCGDLLKTDGKQFFALEVDGTLIVVARGRSRLKLESWLPLGLAGSEPAFIERPTAERVERALAS